MNSQRALIKQISKDQIQIKTKASMQFKRLRGRRYCVDCKSQAFMEGIFSQPNPSKSQEPLNNVSSRSEYACTSAVICSVQETQSNTLYMLQICITFLIFQQTHPFGGHIVWIPIYGGSQRSDFGKASMILETITFFTCDGMVQLHSQGVLDIERCRKLQEKYDQLPTADEQGLCIGATFQLSATNGIDPARRIQVCGFCRCVEYLSDVVGDTVLSKGGEVMLCTTELKHGVTESLKMMVAVPFLWGVPPELDTLRQAIAYGGGFVHKEQKLWQIY
eukprot:TRINITY_DN1183_c0_g1_i4.p1 TRINITY_DN1183_c0_g1~~TRINITY_DN1183_c0_g1_i4.p1  ORF type:complete len:276 (+),score=9.06 TRINITY_DN1183_c0_g1_i4:66-893(+)